MTDRVIAYTVILEKEIRENDAEYIENALRMIKGVLSVVPQVSDVNAYFAQQTAKQDIRQRLWKALEGE